MRRALAISTLLFTACTSPSADDTAQPDGAGAPQRDASATVDGKLGGGNADLSASGGGNADLSTGGGPAVDLASSVGPGGRDWSKDPPVATITGTTEIDAMGDIHGDPATALKVLKAAGLVSSTSAPDWTGGAKTLVVTGDVIDKGSMALPMIDAFLHLAPQAEAAGGHLVVTLGNHEAEFLADPMNSKAAPFIAELQAKGLDPAKVAQGDSPYGQWLRTRPIAALVDGWFFSHAGNANDMSAQAIGQQFEQLFDAGSFSDSFLIGTNSVLEARQWWAGTGASSTSVIDGDLAALPAKHVVFGHQPGSINFPDDPAGTRQAGEMAMRYSGRLFLIDVGMSYAVGDSSGALLRIVRGATTTATAVFPDGTTTPLWSGP